MGAAYDAPVRFDSFWSADAWSFSGMRSRPPSEAGQKCSQVLVGRIAEGDLSCPESRLRHHLEI